MHVRQKKSLQVLVGEPKKRNILENVGTNGWIILKWLLSKQNQMA